MSIKLKFIFILILISVVSVAGYKHFSQSEELSYDFVLAEKGNIVQKVSATGQVTPVKKIDLQFEIQGKIKDVKVEKGEKVKIGYILAKLDTTELEIQILEAEAARNVAKANLEKALSGASAEDIKIYETAEENAQITLQNAELSLKNAEQNLADVKAQAKEDIDQSYQDALSSLDGAYLKAYNALNTVDLIQRTYFDSNDQASIRAKESEQIIENAVERVEICVATARQSLSSQDIDSCSLETNKSLNEINSNLISIRNTMEEPIYRNVVSSSDKTLLDNHRTYINTAYASIINSQQTISSAKLSNESGINTAQASVDSAQSAVTTAEGNLKSAQNKLAQIKAPPRKENVALFQAQLDQSKVSLVRVKQQLSKAILVAPCNGIITDIKKETGEMVRAMTQDTVISLICQGGFQIEVDIPEADIGKLNLQDQAKISLDAFSEKIFQGSLIKIDPAETIIQGVVYYNAIVGFNEADERIKSGMTADVDIIAHTKENVLTVPQRSVLIKNGYKIVRILNNEEINEIEVEIGIRGSKGEIEILSGLKEGDKVITFIREK